MDTVLIVALLAKVTGGPGLYTPSSPASVLTLTAATAAELRTEAAPWLSSWTLEVPTLATQRARTPVQYQHRVYAKYLDSAALTGSKSSFCLQIALKDKWSIGS